MSFVLHHCRRIDAQLDRAHLADLPSAGTTAFSTHQNEPQEVKPRALALQKAVRALSTGEGGSRRKVLGTAASVRTALECVGGGREDVGQRGIGDGKQGDRSGGDGEEGTELEWLVVGKAAVQVYGLALNGFLDCSVGLADEVGYWEEVLESRRNTAVFGAQILPGRVWEWGCGVWGDVVRRRHSGGMVGFETGEQRGEEGGEAGWRGFYDLVRRVVREQSVASWQQRALSPVVRLRSEVRRKQSALKKLRIRNANALGVLLGEGLANESAHGEGLATPSADGGRHKWKVSVARNVALMEAVLAKVHDKDTPVEKFDAAVAECTDDDPLFDAHVFDETGEMDAQALSPQIVAQRLNRVLALALPQFTATSEQAVREHGKPSRIIRYWLPVTLALLSSSTILRILVNRQAEIIQWIADFGATALDFWRNWVVEPTLKVIKTIRHDEGSEVSITSKRSLEGDRASLERMVVDFALDNPPDNSTRLSEPEISDLRLRVREGDLTPVLRAYEKDLQSPFIGTLRGNLIRALLIQVQKTKVDVEVAIGGIDNLLKSQELVFGFIALTPGLLLTYTLLTYLRTTLTTSSSAASARKQGAMLRHLRNIDRILTNAEATEFGELYYKDQGLLLCEAHGLRCSAGEIMGRRVLREFGEDLKEVEDVRSGVERQRRGVERVRWAYGRYL